jgi:hypothetical protein
MAEQGLTQKSSPILIAAAWAVVVLPTAWGLDYTIKNALKIFVKPQIISAPASNPRL